MKPLVAYSVRDPAGLGASRYLVELLGARGCSVQGLVECFDSDVATIAGFDVDVVDLDQYSQFIDGFNYVIVLSRHRAESGRRTFSVHHPGNPTSVAYGGEPRRLAIAYPLLAWELLRTYARVALEMKLEDYEVTLEATHHGPTSLRIPVVFIEIGSTEVEWRDEKARKAMATTVLDVLTRRLSECNPVAALGGPHYPSRYTKASLESNLCFGHIIAKHSLEDSLEDVVKQAITRNHPEPVKTIIVEKKSLKSTQRSVVERVAAELNVKIEYW